MIITILVLLYLAWETYKGYQIGFTKRIVNLTFSAIVFILAIMLQNPFGNWLYTQFTAKVITNNLTNQTDLMLYRFLAFFILFFVGKMIIKIFKKWVPEREKKKSFGSILDGVLGALISLIACYFVVYVVLSMANAFQNHWFIQQTLDSSFLRFIIYDTPGLSNGVFNSIFSISRTAA
jgi:uncharacterized protein YacL